MYNIQSNRILAKNVSVSNDTRKTGLNNNDLIVGPSGSGKTRGYVIPNIIHSEDSMIIADTKGNLCRHYGEYLKGKGYRVMHINFADIAASPWGYNPLSYIRKYHDPEHNQNGDFYNEQDIKRVACAICPVHISHDPFWDEAARMYLETFILYIMNNLPEKEHTLYEAYTLLSRMGTEEFKDLFEDECLVHPNSAFARKYRMIEQNQEAEKMNASIKGILATHLDVISYSATRRLFQMEPQIDLSSFLECRTAVFLDVSDSDRSQDPLVNLFYTQALQYLIARADGQPENRLPIPVRFILDDFSTNTVIEGFDNIISVIRSREIYVSLIIQSISQLEGLYGKAKAQTIINNCDHCLYLGGTDIQTAGYFATKFNCQISTVLNLPLESVYVFARGSQPKKITRYDIGDEPKSQGERKGGLDE